MSPSTKKLVAVVTGASSGIGAATALALASEGYQVVGLAIQFDKELKTKTGEKIPTKICDVSVEEQVIEAFNWINEKFGGVDVLINCAGICKIGGIIHGKYEDWKAMFEINVLGTALCTKEALKTMRQRGDNGVIVNISSIDAKHVAQNLDFGIYSTTKNAVKTLSKATSNELKREKSKIRITNITPGSVFTDLTLRIAAELHGKPYDPNDLQKPLPECFLDPQDIAKSILHILNTPSRVQIPELTIQPVSQKRA